MGGESYARVLVGTVRRREWLQTVLLKNNGQVNRHRQRMVCVTSRAKGTYYETVKNARIPRTGPW
jgi:hypothetical protein